MTEISAKKRKLEPLQITCSSTDCDNGLHCFHRTKKLRVTYDGKSCRYCGDELVDWTRVRMRSLSDVTHTFEALKNEYWRHYYWHVEIDLKALNHARRKGKIGMKIAAEKRIRAAVGSANPYRDGSQTPRNGNLLYYAQHATAACCRTCIEHWHGIPQGQPLTNEQIDYFTKLLMLYINERLPNLTETGEFIPRIC